MNKKALAVLVTALVFAAAAPVSAQFVELPIDERAMVRGYGLWWMTHSRRNNLDRAYASADLAFEKGKLYTAAKRYKILALYGDKFAQFRLGLIALEQGNKEEAYAWFKLANEGGDYTGLKEYPDLVWQDLDVAQRAAADLKLKELSTRFSDFALAHNLFRIFRRQQKLSTGSRVGYVDGLNLIIVGGLNPIKYYGRIRMGINFSQQLMDNYGEVTLGEFEVLEPGEENEAELKSQQPVSD